jgi:hypothetical protein
MKQKAKSHLNSKITLEKRNDENISSLNFITNKLLLNEEQKNKKGKNNKTQIITKAKHNNNKKIKYDPIIFRMIQSHNKKKWNANIVFSVSEFLNFEENLSLRLVCHLFNDGIKNRYEFLKENIVFSMDKRLHEKIRKEYNIQNEKKKSLFSNLIGENFEEENDKGKKYNLLSSEKETGNFSKKQLLIDMINNKYFISIKYRVKKGEFFIPNNLAV